ncbi:D-alanyl-lipoteichoic acid biosynthesis protein DltD [Rossellomorea marisflavi]|uniref:D-alanyl-lipoteichoic acid biosynthesis protein DltD n=1 Tax=Rossellomorea marisflavi TaxID=189381 RepID=UPI0009A5B1BE|nr:D-alanyl-lipoteichoic acid biosynthesis protein DltD [Rossellomorea marisflavi]
MKKKRHIFGPMILAFVLFIGMLSVPNKCLVKLMPDGRLEEAANSLNSNMFAGTYMQDEMLEDPTYLPIYGSSEFSRWDRYHPSNYFMVNDAGFKPFLVGKGGTTSIIHAINLASHADQLQQKQMVIIVSPQWFVKNGTDENHFAPNYSALQAMDLPSNSIIDEDTKTKLMKRMMSYNTVKNDTLVYELYDAYLHDKTATYRGLSAASNLYGKVLEKKDLYYSLFTISSAQRNASNKVEGQSWESLMKMADRTGERHTQHSRFNIDDKVYKKQAREIAAKKGKNKDHSYGVSKEYDDFQLLMDVLKQSKAEPLFVILPVNGEYYDYTGFPKKGRDDYYKRITAQIADNGFEYTDYSDHEYDPYFLKDTIHIAWKGWVYLDRDIDSFVKTGKKFREE